MPALAHQRCFNHVAREAVARCPECSRFYCRECITEHDDRVLCASCLKKLVRAPVNQSRLFPRLLRAFQCLLGILIAWFFFFVIGESLLQIPAKFHEATVWQAGTPEPP